MVNQRRGTPKSPTSNASQVSHDHAEHPVLLHAQHPSRDGNPIAMYTRCLIQRSVTRGAPISAARLSRSSSTRLPGSDRCILPPPTRAWLLSSCRSLGCFLSGYARHRTAVSSAPALKRRFTLSADPSSPPTSKPTRCKGVCVLATDCNMDRCLF